VDNPYYAVTDEQGRFEIGDIPDGTFRMVVWHPYLGGVKEQGVGMTDDMQNEIVPTLIRQEP
jgi:hypothetical protein